MDLLVVAWNLLNTVLVVQLLDLDGLRHILEQEDCVAFVYLIVAQLDDPFVVAVGLLVSMFDEELAHHQPDAIYSNVAVVVNVQDLLIEFAVG